MKKLFTVLFATMLLVGCGTTTKVEEPKTDEYPDSYVEYLAQKDQEILDAAQAAADQKKQEELEKYGDVSEEELAVLKRKEFIEKYIEDQRVYNEELQAESEGDVSKSSAFAEYDEATDTLTTTYSFRGMQNLVNTISNAEEPDMVSIVEWFNETSGGPENCRGVKYEFENNGYAAPQHIKFIYVSDIDPDVTLLECVDGVITYDILQSVVEKHPYYQEYVERGERQ